MTSITITLPLPSRDLSPNGRIHHMARHAARKVQRVAAWALALEAMDGNPPPMWKRAVMDVRWYHPTIGWPDSSNCLACLKGAEDGLQDAGVVDNDKHVEIGKITREKDATNPRVEIEITPLPKGPTP